MTHYGGHSGGFGGGGYNAEKVSQIISGFLFLIGLIETFFVIRDEKSFLAANIPYLQFDITSPAYGFVIAITMAVTLAVALGLALRTIAIIGIMFWLAVSGLVTCSSKGVNFAKLDNTTLSAGDKKTGVVEQSLIDTRNAIKSKVNQDDKKPNTTNNVFANLDKNYPDMSTAIKNGTIEKFLSDNGYTFVKNLTQPQLDWCETAEGTNALIAGDLKAWINCSTGKKYTSPKK